MNRCEYCGKADGIHYMDCPYAEMNEPFSGLLLQEQRRLVRIGGQPCEWTSEQWAQWSAKEHD